MRTVFRLSVAFMIACCVTPISATPLHRAAAAGNLSAVKKLITEGGDINATDQKGRPPLYAAALAGHANIAKLLVSHSADLKLRDNWGFSPIHGAAYNGHWNVIQFFLDQGIDINSASNTGWTPILSASANGQRSTLLRLIDKGADVNAKFPEGNEVMLNTGETLLHRSAQAGNTQFVQLLLDHGANVNEMDDRGEIPLHEAVKTRQYDIVQILIDHGANVNVHDIDGLNPLKRAQAVGDNKIAELLISYGAYSYQKPDPTKPKFISNRNPGPGINTFLAGGGDINMPDENGNTPLHWAASEGQEAVITLLLAKGAEVNVANRFYDTPLHLAARHRRSPIVQQLLEKGADISAQDASLWTPLHWAARQGHTDTVVLLLERGAEIDAETIHLTTPLYEAIYGGMQARKAAAALIKRRANVNIANFQRVTALHQAADKGELDLVTQMIEHGVDIAPADYLGKTALLYAALRHNLRLTKLLLDNGADINYADHTGATSLHYAIFYDWTDLAKLLIDHDPKWPLHIAAWVGNPEIVRYLIDRGVDIKAKDGQGRTALYYAKQKDHVEIIPILQGSPDRPDPNSPLVAAIRAKAREKAREYAVMTEYQWHLQANNPLHKAIIIGDVRTTTQLIAEGADLNVEERLARCTVTPLHCAATLDRESLVTLLLKHGADVDQRDSKQGRTALHWAVQFGHLEIAKILLDKNADIQARSAKGRTPLDLAASYGHLEIVKMLLKAGADVNATDVKGHTPLINTSNTQIVTLLLAAGADINAQGRQQDTALHDAAKHSSPALMQFLIDHGANLSATDRAGKTPLHYAAELGRYNAIQLLLTNGADINQTDKRRNGVLHMLMEDDAAFTKLLLDHGANPNTPSASGRTPLHCSAYRGLAKTTTLLIEAGADVNALNKWNDSPLTTALKARNNDIAEILLQHGAKK